MRIARGIKRTALIGNSYTLKIANISFLKGIRDIRLRAKRGKGRLKAYFSAPPEAVGGFRYHFLRGIYENRREGRLSKTLGDVVVPTRFSFLGIFNVQDTAEQHGLRGIEDIFVPLFDRIDAVREDRHTFAYGDNYGVHQGRLKVIDYGGKRSTSVLLRFRSAFRDALDSVLPPT